MGGGAAAPHSRSRFRNPHLELHPHDILPFALSYAPARPGGRADFALEEHKTRRLCKRLHEEVNSALIDQAGPYRDAVPAAFPDIDRYPVVVFKASQTANSDDTQE
jgi:hypothetical protein